VTRGEIYRLRSDSRARGHEIRGARYAVVVQADELAALSTVIIAPTSASAPPSWIHPEVKVAGRATRVLVEHNRAVDASRLGSLAGALTRRELDDVDDALRAVVGLN
jgi:mRNA interferase MazF